MSQPFGSWPAIPGTDPLRPLRTSLPWGKPLITIDGWDPMLQIVTANRITGDNVTGTNNWIASFVGFGSDTALGPALAFSTSRSRHSQSPTIVSNGDNFGALRFYGADGYTYLQGAAFLAESDGTPSSNSMPGRLTFLTNTSGTPNLIERLRIDSQGRLLSIMGASAIPSVFDGSGHTVHYQFVNGSGGIAPSAMALFRFENATNGPAYEFCKSRNATIGSHTATNSGDHLGHIIFNGSDGTAFQTAAVISAQADFASTSANVPGRLSFWTTTSSVGQNFTAERMRIDSSGNVSLGGNAALSTFPAATTPLLQVPFGIGIHRFAANSGGAKLDLSKARDNTVGTYSTAVSSGDSLGIIVFGGADTISLRPSSAIEGVADLLFSSGSAPGRLSFSTTTSGSTTLTERMRLDRNGAITAVAGVATLPAGGAPIVASSAVIGTISDTVAIYNFGCYGVGNSPAGAGIQFAKTRAATDINTKTAVNSGDVIGLLDFYGANANTWGRTGAFACYAALNHTSGSSPGMLSFFTTTSGSTAITERLRIDQTGVLVTGAVAPFATLPSNINGLILNDAGNKALISCNRFGANQFGPGIWFAKSRQASVSSTDASGQEVLNNDAIGEVVFGGALPSGGAASYSIGCELQCTADANWSSGSSPGKFQFYTAASGSTSQTERLRIDSGGRIIFEPSGGAHGALALLSNLTTGIQYLSTASPETPVLELARFTSNQFGSEIWFAKSRSATVGVSVSGQQVQSGDSLGIVSAGGALPSGSSATPWAFSCGISFVADATFSSNSSPGRIVFNTSTSGGTSLTERMRIDPSGAVFFPTLGTSASAANAFINNASSPVNSLLRSTSSIRYKTDVADVEASRIAAVERIRPVEFTSTASADSGDDTRFVGYIAEEVAEADRALVFLDSEGRPDGVMYDRVLLMQLEALRRRVEELERQQTRH